MVGAMLRRELLLVFRARVTWLAAALSAVLVGHGFILAADIYVSASRSAVASVLMRREMDPLGGIVRPTLGGLELATALLAPLVAARVLAIEKERGGFGPLLLQVGSGRRVVAAKLVAALAGTSLLLLAPVLLLLAFALAGGHLDVVETATALGGHALHLVVVTAVSLAAAAWTDTVAVAVTLGLVVSLGSWAIDASEGFSAVAWLAPLGRLSMGARLSPFEHGVLATEQVLAFGIMIAGAIALAILGVRPRSTLAQRIARFWGVVVASMILVALSARAHRAFDWTEQRRASLPPAVADGLRAIPEPISIEVWLDAEDSRRRQLETDTLAKLRIARGDLRVATPLDTRAASEAAKDADYGKLIITVGNASRTTRSTSRHEIITLVFEAAGRALPDWNQPDYPGYPLVIEGSRRSLLALLAYVALPGALLALGFAVSRTPKRRTT
jgi:hypothetical protein